MHFNRYSAGMERRRIIFRCKAEYSGSLASCLPLKDTVDFVAFFNKQFFELDRFHDNSSLDTVMLKKLRDENF